MVPPERLSELDIARKCLTDGLAKGIIEESQSSWRLAIFPVSEP